MSPSSNNTTTAKKKDDPSKRLKSKLSDIFLRHEDTFVDRFLDRLRETRLPPLMQIYLAYWIAALCLVYYAYVFVRRVVLRIRTKHNNNEAPQIPLMTESGDLIGTFDARQVYQELRRELHQVSRYNTTWTDAQLVHLVRSNSKVRRLVSRLLCHCQQNLDHTDDNGDDKIIKAFQQQLLKLWPQLLELPAIDNNNTQKEQFMHSLIVPAHKEDGLHLARTLQHARKHCSDPSTVTVVIVDAGLNTNMDQVAVPTSSNNNNNNENGGGGKKWGSFRIVPFKKGGGRGPAQNEGALCAHATLLTFLHSDTLLPQDWDLKVQQALLAGDKDSKKKKTKVHHACAFSFGFDLSKEGLESHARYPWGVSAIALLANVRANYLNLPYGDQVISMPSQYFHYVGGFPAQPIFEDYDLMDLFRQRARMLGNQKEKLKVIPKPAVAYCHPRRYQQYGTCYVTLVNVLNVYRFREGWKPSDIYDYYYKRPLKKTD